MNEQDTISAISTANGAGGVAIIRISGEKALDIAEKMFIPMGKNAVKAFEPYRMYPGNIQAEYFTDFGMCVYFKGPKSYTGEDIVELHCHGGTQIAQGVLKQTFRYGARCAEAGEFTRRAFLNGKMSLSAAEGVADMINARSESMIKAGYSLYNNELGNKVTAIQNKLKNLLASIEVDIDYPEEELERSIPDLSNVENTLKGIRDQVSTLKNSYETIGRTVKGGISVAIVGKPNSGKSSLLNAILGYNKAIVSDIEGTTRDIVEGEIDLKGVRFHFYDTAGIRESGDFIEQIGVQKAEEVLENADIVLHVVDGSVLPTKEDEALCKRITEKNRFLSLLLLNKQDIATCDEWQKLPTEVLTISAKEGNNISVLLQKLSDRISEKYSFDSEFVVEERHYRALCRAYESIARATDNCVFMPIDMLTIDLSECWQILGEITGETANEEIIGEIFSKFCVGK